MHGAWLWARREIARGWASLVVVALILGITGGAVTAGAAGARRAGASVDRFLVDTSLPTVTIYTEAPLPADLRTALADDPSIRAVLDEIVVLATPATAGSPLDGVVVVVPDAYLGDVVQPRLVSGRLPAAADEVVVSETGRDVAAPVGDTFRINVLDGEALAECTRSGVCDPRDGGEVTITGVVRLASDLAPGPFANTVFLASEAFTDRLGGPAVAFGFITDLVLDGDVDPDDVVTRHSTAVAGGNIRSIEHGDLTGARRAVEFQHDALLLAAAIVAAAGLLVVSQAFGRFNSRRANDADRLAAVGMVRRERTIAAWIPSVVATVLGAALVIPTAVVLSPAFPLGVGRRADPDVGFHADALVIGAGVAMTFAVGALVALAAAFLWSRATPRSVRPARVTAVASLGRSLGLRPVPNTGLRLAWEPGRAPRRVPVLPTLVATTAAVGVCVGAVVVTTSLDGLLTTPARSGVTWDLHLSPGDSTIEVGDQIAADERVDGTALAVSGELDVSTAERPPVRMRAVGFSSIKGSLAPVILDGDAPVGPTEVMLGTDTFERLGVAVGDEIAVAGPHGEASLVVTGRGIVPGLSDDSPDDGVVVAVETMLELGGTETGADVDVEPAVFVTVADDGDLVAVTDDIEATGVPIDGPYLQSAVSVLDEVRLVPRYVAAFMAILGLLALFHSLVVVSRRRRNQLATLRALGFRPGQAAATIRWCGGVAALTAVVAGTVIGLIGGRLLWTAIAEGMHVVPTVDVPWPAIALMGLVIIAMSAVFVAAWPASVTARRNVAVDLRAE